MNAIIDIAEKVSGYLDNLRPGKLFIISICLNALQFCILVLVFLALEATFLNATICHVAH